MQSARTLVLLDDSRLDDAAVKACIGTHNTCKGSFNCHHVGKFWIRGAERGNGINGMLQDVCNGCKERVSSCSACRGNVGEIMDQKDQRGVKAALLRDLDLEQVLDRDVEHLSGGELQRFAIAVVVAQQADVYMIDEPSSYLDVRQRLKAAQVRRPREQHCSTREHMHGDLCFVAGAVGRCACVTHMRLPYRAVWQMLKAAHVKLAACMFDQPLQRLHSQKGYWRCCTSEAADLVPNTQCEARVRQL